MTPRRTVEILAATWLIGSVTVARAVWVGAKHLATGANRG